MEVEEPIPEDKDAEKKDDKKDDKKDPDVSINLSSPIFPIRSFSDEVQSSSDDERASKRPRLRHPSLTPQLQAMDTDEKPKMRKVKKQVRKGELPIVSG